MRETLRAPLKAAGTAAFVKALLERSDTPWYPTMRLFRQSEILVWRPVFEAMAEALKPLVAANTSG